MLTPPHTNGGPHSNGAPLPSPPVLAAWTGVLGRRWGWGAGVAFLVLGAVVLFLVFQRPLYRAEARLRLADPPPMTGVSPTSGMLSLFGSGNAFANDFQVLRSRTLMEAVAAETSLNLRLDAPAGWHRDSLFTSVVAGSDTEAATFDVSWAGGGVQVRRSAPTDSVVGTFAPGVPASFGGVTVVFKARPPDAPESFRVTTMPFGAAVRGLSGRLETQRATRDANVLDLRFDDSDPALAERVVRSAVAHFIALRAELYQRESGQAVDSLRVVASQTMRELEEAENRLEALQRESGLVAAEAQSEAMVERYTAALLAAEAAGAELEAVTTAISRVDASANPGEAWTSLVAHPQFLENLTVGGLLTQMTALEQQRIQLAAVRAPENVEYRTVVDQIASLDAALRAVARNYRSGLRERVQIAEAKVAELEGMLAAAPAQMMELLRRQRDMRVLTEVVVLTEQRLRQEELRQALTFSNAQVIDPAALLYRPVWPRPKLMLAAGLLIALAFGLLAMVVVERADGSVRSARQLAPYMASPLLAAVPAGRRNGRVGVVELTPAELEVLLRRGRVDEARRSHLLLVSAGAPADAESLARALEGAAQAENGRGGGLVPALTVLPPVTTRAAAESAARQGAPVLIVLRAGDSDGRRVAGMLELLTSAGAPVAGGVLLCRTTREATIAWT